MSKKKNITTKEISEEERLQREKNREKALRESRKKKDAKLKAKAKKHIAKKAEQKAGKKARHKEARKASLERFKKKLKGLTGKRNRYVLIAFMSCIVLGIIFYFAANHKSEKPEVTEKAETVSAPQKSVSSQEETVSEDSEKEEEKETEKDENKRQLKVLSDTGKDTASSVSENLQDIYPHDGGLYLMPDENDEESIKGQLMSAIVLKKDDYEKLKTGEILELEGIQYVLLAVNKDGEYGAALSMTEYEEGVDYEKIIAEEESFEDYFGYEKLVYGMTVGGEEAQIEMLGGTDYFENDGYEKDDMIFFAGTALYLPLCRSLDTGVTLHFDDDCVLTVPDDTMLKDTEYDTKAYLRGENLMYPPDLMAAKIETEGDRIKKYNVMFVLPEDLDEADAGDAQNK